MRDGGHNPQTQIVGAIVRIVPGAIGTPRVLPIVETTRRHAVEQAVASRGKVPIILAGWWWVWQGGEDCGVRISAAVFGKLSAGER